ncbi:phage major capsid protein, P2 family [Sphingomonas sp. QA11]|uniref:phage major capsid protein, P2 family n=1 Tax=Sphingomonas sp. QA11 TaxID=2950605 RepID=UPI002348FA82|nr:phage major capsid protein, P2 family [Sphingomonas sp. QA11]WCM29181.1 phage major capsid protein, P2 family [Sphingomonas sp. QA11]
MRNETRLLFHAYLNKLAKLNGVASASESFSVAPSVGQKLQELIQKSSAFLQKIAFETVVQQEGDKVGVGVTRSIAGRVNTNAGTRRSPTDPTDTSDLGRYRCEETFYDSAIKWSRLDAWAHKPEFQQLIRDVIIARQALDRITIGFHGTSVAATTDRVANPRLQDVNKGWLHKIRTYAPDRVLSDGGLTTTGSAIYVADTADTSKRDYVNIDALVKDVSASLLDEWHQDADDLVVMIGRDLVHDKYMPIINKAGDTPTEILARNAILAAAAQVGGYPAERVPDFPSASLLITSYKNLAIYEQDGTRRRYVKDEPELTQIANYESVNEAFVVEDYGKCALVENIVMGPKPA